MFTQVFSGNDTFDTTYFKDREVNDRLEGFAGNDKLIAGIGADRLYGGKGADTFIYKSVGDSTLYSYGRDTIFDFSSKQKDKIDLRKVDANELVKGNQAFRYIGKDAFHNQAGELRWEKSKSGTYVYGDVDGDSIPDLSIFLKNVTKLAKSDFYL